MTVTMSGRSGAVSAPSRVTGRRHAAVVPVLFASVVFVSAALDFLVEPMIGKLVLPTLGGSPAVWNTTLAFFQAALLVGYGYAHLLQRLRSVRWQALIHGAVLLGAALTLPLRISTILGEPDPHSPILWLLVVLGVSVGLPFATLSATAPLVQAWYARTRTGGGEPANPYGLYAASNLGSLIALLSYPLVIEPLITLRAQSVDWGRGYAAFVLLIGCVAALVWPAGALSEASSEPKAAATPVVWRERLIWIALAAVPSSLMLGVTTHIASDIASAPLLWVVPLAIYLVTFIIAFQRKPLIGRDTALVFQAAAFVACVMTIGLPLSSVLLQAALDLVGFFLTALVCHQALAARRPPAAQLTEYYLLMSLGGVIGGAFNAFLAPTLFRTVIEYPLVLALSALARPWRGGPLTRRESLLLGVGLIAGIAAIVVGRRFGFDGGIKALFAGLTVVTFMLRERTLPFLALCLVILAGGLSLTPPQDILLTDRSFFGVVRLLRVAVPEHGDARVMVHGTTMHGAQLLDPAERCRPLLYYAPTTPIGQVFRAAEAAKENLSIGAIGMGVGTVATYTRPGDSLRFFEIDPLVARLANDPALFTYIHGCAKGQIDDVLGDARLTLAHEANDHFDLLLVDAFSSDSVPAHLLTVEAMRAYLSHIKPDGVVVMHLSNNNLELMRPVAAIATAAGGFALQQAYRPPAGAIPQIDAGEDAVIVARTPEALAAFRADTRWKPAASNGVAAWTDDYTNLLGALVRGIGHIDREARS